MKKKSFDDADVLGGLGFVLVAVGGWMMVSSIAKYQDQIKKTEKKKE